MESPRAMHNLKTTVLYNKEWLRVKHGLISTGVLMEKKEERTWIFDQIFTTGTLLFSFWMAGTIRVAICCWSVRLKATRPAFCSCQRQLPRGKLGDVPKPSRDRIQTEICTTAPRSDRVSNYIIASPEGPLVPQQWWYWPLRFQENYGSCQSHSLFSGDFWSCHLNSETKQLVPAWEASDSAAKTWKRLPTRCQCLKEIPF